MTNSLLVNASSASLSSADWDTAKSPAFAVRLNCRCSSAWLVALVRNANDCVRTNEIGADSSWLYIPTVVGVGYSLIPSMAPTRVSVGDRYSMVSLPKSSRPVARIWLSGFRATGMGWLSPLIRRPRYSRRHKYHAPA